MTPREFERVLANADLRLVGTIEGFCPVQASGTIDGHPFYFRARGETWSFRLARDPNGDPHDVEDASRGFFREEPWGAEENEAGWMPLDEAERWIERCALDFLRERRT